MKLKKKNRGNIKLTEKSMTYIIFHVSQFKLSYNLSLCRTNNFTTAKRTQSTWLTNITYRWNIFSLEEHKL